ncbi:MAG: tagaturonate reductase, partial [Bacteroidota bacterium]
DRIVPGVQKEKLPEVWESLGYEDHLVTEGEPYHLWVIEAPDSVAKALPLQEVGLNVVYTNNLEPYRKQKVRILNGSHTSIVPVGYLSGLRIVRDTVNDQAMGKFLSQLLSKEILPVIDMPAEQVEAYANTVIDRFKNPYIDHYLISIALNSFSKFKSRLLPSAIDYFSKYNQPPEGISFALACTILFYKGEYDGEEIALKDDQLVLDKLKSLWANHADEPEKVVQSILRWSDFWGQDLSSYKGFKELVIKFIKEIMSEGVSVSLKRIL